MKNMYEWPTYMDSSQGLTVGVGAEGQAEEGKGGKLGQLE